MKRRHWILPILVFLLHSGVTLEAQQEKVVVLSPRVGMEIDRDERDRFAVFQTVRDFYHVEVRHQGDSSFILLFRLGDDVRGYRDSSRLISYRAVVNLAEKIQYYDEIIAGWYRMGSGDVTLSYADGSPVIMEDQGVIEDLPPVHVDVQMSKKETAAPQPSSAGIRSDRLPLAKDKRDLRRPMFGTYTFCLSADFMGMNIDELKNLPGDKGGSAFGLSLKLGIALQDDPSLRLLGGWTFFLDHEITNYSLAALWQPVSFGDQGPLVGVGAGRINFDFSGNGLHIIGDYTYPLLMLGWSIYRQHLEVLMTLPFGEVSTTFENKRYAIAPAGPSVSIMFSL
ncbi:MAG: hypothetical protein M5R41_13965 [Bacteroidia bacterium]|nr:hypothetical protein [Bacteroidia bacterium]